MVRSLLVALAAGLFLAFSGAFGSGDASLQFRLLYWLPLLVAGTLWGTLCSQLVERYLDVDARPWLGTLALTLVITGPLTLFVWAMTGLIFNNNLLNIPSALRFLPSVTIITAMLSALNIFLGRKTPHATHAARPDEAPAQFLNRLPARLKGGNLYAVQSEDHYLRLYTDRGSDLILMRLGDALNELEGLEGAQTHRSWWVAKNAVIRVSRGDGRASLTLTDGTVAPVSRRYARALREAGWW